MGLAMLSLLIASPIYSLLELLGVNAEAASGIAYTVSAPLIIVAIVLCIPLALIGGIFFGGAGLIGSFFSWI